MIHHVTPWRTGDIGGGLNAAIQCMPENAWVCLRDGDTLFLSDQWGAEIEEIVAEHGYTYDLIGCMTNRIRAPYQLHDGKLSEEADMHTHLRIAKQRWAQHGTAVAPVPVGPIAGMMMLFRRSTWARHPFPERSIYFDKVFTDAVRENHGQVGVALGLYIFHLYRWGKRNPTARTEHLQGVN
jgi:hypothetical protein